MELTKYIEMVNTKLKRNQEEKNITEFIRLLDILANTITEKKKELEKGVA